jgi:hypothetical protein
VGYFYQEIGDKLLIGAQQTLSKYGIDEKNVDIFYAPGAFEIPYIASGKHTKGGWYFILVRYICYAARTLATYKIKMRGFTINDCT